MAKLIYLDYAAATPMANEVLVAMQPYWQEKFYNPSAASLPAKAVKQELEAARASVAQQLGARPGEIIFTAGGTEANNLAIHGLLANYPDGHIVTTGLEHESVLLPARHLGHISEVAPNRQGLVSPEAIAAAVIENTVLVTVMYANNEVGTVQPIKRIAAALANIRAERQKNGNTTPLFFHTDAAQAANYLDLHVHRLGVDLMTLNGGKIYGPKQSGVLFVRSGIILEPILRGGGQENGKRSGTENVAGSIGFASALALAVKKRSAETSRLEAIQAHCYKDLAQEIPVAVVNGSIKYRLPNNIHITVPSADNERLLYGLEEAGVVCAAGSACSASKEEASHVLLAMGMSEADARASLRVSFGRQTETEDIDKFVAALKALL